MSAAAAARAVPAPARAPTVLTVILNWRTAEMTLRAAEAALRAMAGVAGEIVIVDNDSGDGSYETMAAAVAAAGWPRTRVAASGRNGGFGAGNNHGIRLGFAGGGTPDYVYLLNSDAFPEPGAVRALVEHLEAHPRCGLAGSLILGEDGAPQRTAFRYPSLPGEFEAAAKTGPISRLLARSVVAPPIPPATCEVDWTAGASLMIRRAALDEIGLFDEGFFLYYEETDLCRRAARAGWTTAYVRESAVVHIGSVSTGLNTGRRMPAYWFESRLRYFVKHHGVPYAAGATAAHVAGGLLWRLRCAVERRPTEEPPRFLPDMVGHALRAAAAGLRAPRRRGPAERGPVERGRPEKDPAGNDPAEAPAARERAEAAAAAARGG